MDTNQTVNSFVPFRTFKKGDRVSLTEEAKKILTFLKKDIYEIKGHSKDSSASAEIVVIIDDDNDDRDVHADYLEIVSSS